MNFHETSAYKRLLKTLKAILKQKIENYNKLSKLVTDNNKQFKTERWIETEMILYLLDENYSIIPEFNNKEWDIKLTDNINNQEFYVQLKDYSGSKQNFNKDIQGIKKDLNMILHKENSVLVFILSLEKRSDYENQFKSYFNEIENIFRYNSHIRFTNSADKGIQFYILSKITN